MTEVFGRVFAHRRALIIAIVNFMLLVQLAVADCDPASTPSIKKDRTAFTLVEGTPFSYDFNLTNINESLVIYNYLLLQGSPTGVKLSPAGVLTLSPGREDAGENLIAVVAYHGSCADLAVINLSILSRPRIFDFTPDSAFFGRKQTEDIRFSVAATTENTNKELNYTWYFNQTRISAANTPSYVLRANPDLSGNYNMSVVVTDAYGLNTTFTWEFLLIEVNKPPVLAFDLPGVVVFKNVLAGAYNLNDYFFDPEKAKLKYEYKKILPEQLNITSANVTVNLSSEGYITYYPELDSIGVAYFVFTAIDVFGAKKDSNIVRVDVMPILEPLKINSTQITEFCGDSLCNALENCTTCPEDCGLCDKGTLSGCSPSWNCTEWSACMPWEIQLRNCTDINECKDNRTGPAVVKRCLYNATCKDGLRNGIETGVDCGGPCKPCPTCNDTIQNGGEEGVDCGGPCKVCPSCVNAILDQNESDVDCGGECLPCPGNKSCRLNKDCESLLCKFLVCEPASCFDRIKNQGEKGIDCEGPCEAVCSTCKDGVQNGNEGGVDCGGKCKPCPSCSDGTKNQGEIFTDCGGSCRSCTVLDFFLQFYVAIIILSALIVVLFVDVLAYFMFLLSHPEKAQKLYESNTFFVFMTWMHNFLRPARMLFGRRPFLGQDDYNECRYLLSQATRKAQIERKELHLAIVRVLSHLFQLPDDFDEQMLVKKIRSAKVMPFMKILMIGFYRKTTILVSSSFTPEEELSSIAAEMKYLLSELSKA